MKLTLEVTSLEYMTRDELLNLIGMADRALSKCADPPVELTPVEKCLIDGKLLIPAIKMLRERIPNLGLREAKDLCEAYRDRSGASVKI